VRRDMFDRTKVQHFHVVGNVKDIDPSNMPTLAAAHFSPNCRTTSALAAWKHPRSPEDDMVATQPDATEASKDWDLDVAHFRDIVRDQRRRTPIAGEPESSGFGFTFEQPHVRRAWEHLSIKMMMKPRANGGDGAERILFHFCAFSVPYYKPTDIYVSQLPELKKILLDEKGLARLAKSKDHFAWSRFKCPGKCAMHQHEDVSYNTKTSVCFPQQLASDLARGIAWSV